MPNEGTLTLNVAPVAGRGIRKLKANPTDTASTLLRRLAPFVGVSAARLKLYRNSSHPGAQGRELLGFVSLSEAGIKNVSTPGPPPVPRS